MIYIVLLFILLFGAFYFNDKRPDRHNSYLIFEYVAIVLIFGLRYKVGGDSLNYFSQFPFWPTIDKVMDYDVERQRYNGGWLYFAAICKYIYNDFATVQMVQALIVNAAFLSFFKRYVKRYFMANLFYALMYIFTFNTEIMRAALVVSIFLFGFSTFVKKQWVRYYLLCLLAFWFHNEAVVLFVLPICYPLGKMKPTVTNLCIVMAVSIGSVVALDFIPSIMSVLSVSERVVTTFQVYSNLTFQPNLNGYIMQVIVSIPWLFFLWLSRNEDWKLDKERIIWRGFIILYVFVTMQELKYQEFMHRACDALYPFTILAIMYALDKRRRLRSSVMRFAIIASVVLVVGVRSYRVFGQEHWKLFYPYYSIINPKDDPERYKMLRYFQ